MLVWVEEEIDILCFMLTLFIDSVKDQIQIHVRVQFQA